MKEHTHQLINRVLFAAIVCVVALSTYLVMTGIAHGDPAAIGETAADLAQVAPAVAPAAPVAPATPAVASDPLVSIGQAYALWKSGALIPAILLGLFGAALFLKQKVAWLSEGKRAAYSAAAVAALAVFVEPASRGATPNLGMIIAALAAGAALVLSPVPKVKNE